MLWLVPPLLLAAGTALAEGGDAAARARALDREASELSALLQADDERFAEETSGDASLAAEASDYAALDARTKELVDEVLARAEAHRHETRPLRLRVAVLADEIQRYRETGDLTPPSPRAVARLSRFLDAPWKHRVPDPAPLSQDLLVMQRQLRRWDSAGRVSALMAARGRRSPPRRSPRGESAARPAVVAERPAALLMRDAGTGLVKTDPVPALLSQLKSGEPRLRALAAEELGQLRDGRAVAPLRGALSDRSPRVRASAALALGEIGDASQLVIADLEKALGDPSEEVRVDTRTALSFLVRR